MDKVKICIHPMRKLDTLKNSYNPYMYNLVTTLKNDFNVVNINDERSGSLYFFLFRYFFKAKWIFFNWVENYRLKHLIYFIAFIPLAKLFGKKIVWTHHNVFSHNDRKYIGKVFIKLFNLFGDKIIIHTTESLIHLKRRINDKKIIYFFHPVMPVNDIVTNAEKDIDILIWGKYHERKGIDEFLNFAIKNKELQNKKIKVVSKFDKNEDFKRLTSKYFNTNISIENKYVTEEELIKYHIHSRYIFFIYSGPSVLNSGALAFSLPLHSEIIGPRRGAFKELGDKGLILNYEKFQEIADIVNRGNKDTYQLRIAFCENLSWLKFSHYLSDKIY